MIFMFSTVYRVTQKDFYAHPYSFLFTLYTVEDTNFIKLLGTKT
jgi:hypothetical protein